MDYRSVGRPAAGAWAVWYYIWYFEVAKGMVLYSTIEGRHCVRDRVCVGLRVYRSVDYKHRLEPVLLPRLRQRVTTLLREETCLADCYMFS